MKYADIVAAVKEHVTMLFQQATLPYLLYHNLQHTAGVVTHAMEIAGAYSLSDKEECILYTAAWFHDTGHLFGRVEVHEATGVRLMTNFFEERQFSPELIPAIAACIMATRYPPAPANLLEEIICDADTYHFGTAVFRQTDEQVKEEMEIRTNKSSLHWYSDSLKMLETHRFFTAYCRNKLEAGKQENISYLKEKI